MKQELLETLIGFAVLVTAGLFFMFAYKSGNVAKVQNGYAVKARFQNAEGIVAGSDVMLAGIKIGFVENMMLDKETFYAVTTLRLDSNIEIPKDSTAAIVTSGFLGGKLIAITPGEAEENLKNNDQIKYTQSSINIESLIGKFMYSSGSK